MSWKIIIPISFIVFLVGFWNRNNLTDSMPALDELNNEPLQEKVDRPAFNVTVDDIDYQIQPLYDYDLYGMVVSYRHHDGEYGLHKLWGDSLNVADFCVVWRQNAFTAQLDKIDFWNGQFTCNVKTGDTQAWQSFNINQLSNNHLLTTDKSIRRQLESIGIGDQIRIKGWLSSYKNSKGGSRGTSITRDDTGNGACETIYVNDVEILSEYSTGWRKLMYFSLALLLLSLLMYFKAPPRIQG